MLIGVVRNLLLSHGISYISPQPGVLVDDEDGGTFDMPLDLALLPGHMLPVFVKMGRLVYGEAWLNLIQQGQAFPFDLEESPDGLMGVEVSVVAGAGVAPVEVALTCVVDAVIGFIERMPPQHGVLALG